MLRHRRDILPYALAVELLWLAGLSLGCGGASDSATGAGTTTGAVPRPAAPAGSEPRARPTLTLDSPKGTYPIVWVRKHSRVEIRTEPNGAGEHVEIVGRRTEFNSPTVFGVLDQAGDYAAVSTPYLENGRPGWVRLDPKRLRAGWTGFAIEVDLSERKAALRDDGDVVRSFPVSVGAPGYDTPTGRFAVTDTFRGDLNAAAYGCCALAISATQPHVPSGWLGGNRIAIHGTTGALGEAVSHGCVRAADAEVDALVSTVPLGAPVFIRR